MRPTIAPRLSRWPRLRILPPAGSRRLRPTTPLNPTASLIVRSSLGGLAGVAAMALTAATLGGIALPLFVGSAAATAVVVALERRHTTPMPPLHPYGKRLPLRQR